MPTIGIIHFSAVSYHSLRFNRKSKALRARCSYHLRLATFCSHVRAACDPQTSSCARAFCSVETYARSRPVIPQLSCSS